MTITEKIRIHVKKGRLSMSEADLGQVIDGIRRNRNFTIEALCEGIISPSTYSRFVNGKTFLSTESFMKLVFRLHMTFAMFLQDYQDFFRIKHHYANLNHAKGYRDIDLVQGLVDEYQSRKSQAGWEVQDERFLKVAIALLSQLSEAPECNQHLKVIQDHMKQLKHLTDNDFFALKLLLPYMTLKEAEAVVKKPLKQFTDLKEPALAENLYYVCGIMYVKNLQAGQQKKADAYYEMLDEIYLDQMDLGWKLSQQMYQNIHLYFSGETERAIDQLEKVNILYSDLNLPHQSAFLAQICLDLGIPHKEYEVIK